MLKPLAAWLLILALAVANGALREAVLLPHLARSAAFVLSGLLLSGLILIAAITLARWLALTSTTRCLEVGLFWFGLTLAFEFGFGALRGLSWREMLEAYTFKDGNLWPLVLLVTLLAPMMAARLRKTWRS